MKIGNIVIGMLLSLSVSALAQVPQAQVQYVGQAVEVQQAPQQQQIVQQQAPVVQTTTAQPVIVIQKQPEAVVEAAPLAESTADRIRRKRLEIEQATESKIVEKLEQERIKEEEARANKIINGLENSNAIAAPAVVAPAAAQQAPAALQPVQVIQAQPVVVEAQPSVSPVQTTVAPLVAAEAMDVGETKYYISADLGFVSYPSADNVQTSGGLGTTFGMIFDRKYILEGSFLYSSGEVEVPTRPYLVGLNQYGATVYPTIVQMSQYNYTAAFKYLMGEKRLRFVLGGLVSYTYRDYVDEQFFYPDYRLRSNSWSADMGLILGAMIKLSEKFMLGADFKYVFNVTYDISTSSGLQESKLIYDSFYNSPIEEAGYYNFLMSAKYLF